MHSFDIASALGIPDLGLQLEQLELRVADTLATDNVQLRSALAHLLKAQRKRLRPSLVIAIVASQGHDIDSTVLAGCTAVEMVHLASLVHDDIMDDASTRWGVPTINAKGGIGQAILVGDYLLAKACQVAATISTEVAQVIAGAITSLVDGQARESADKYNVRRTQESYLHAINGKTASLFSVSCRIGGMCADSAPDECDAFAIFGEKFGMAFQIIDDVLDFISSPELSGKPVGNDIAEGVYTMPLLLALNGAHGREVRSLLRADDRASQTSLVKLLDRTSSIEDALAEAKKFSQAASDAISGIENLRSFPDTYIDWALKNLVGSKQ